MLSLLVLSPFVCAADVSSGEEIGGVMLYEVQPTGSGEGFSVFNYSQKSVNLKGWSATDGEGTLTFAKDINIASGTRLTFVKTVVAGDWFSSRSNVIAHDDSRIEKKGTFTLADAGDDLYLYNGSVLKDTVCYGNKKTEQGWTGDPVRMPSGKYIMRIGMSDTNALSDWIATKPGLTNHTFDPELFFDAKVTPFSFPESEGAPIFRTIESAEKEVLISIYLLTNVQLVALLCDMERKGVEVTVLLEGNMLGDNGFSTELTLMRSLVDAGGDVYLINDSVSGNFERYSYLHNKYAVIDERAVIVTSENWTQSNLGAGCSNRGWGVIVESIDYAEYVKSIFINDVNREWGDVRALTDAYPGLDRYAGTLTYGGEMSSYETVTYDARVLPAFSPDDTHDALEYFIEKAERRVYAQQMDIGSSYERPVNGSPLRWLAEAADRGVETRLILDATFTKNETETLVKHINDTTGIEAKAVSGRTGVFSLIHNKGVIIDDMVWVASVNWTESSFLNNREIALVIDSPEVTEFFAELFAADWGAVKTVETIKEDDLEVTVSVLSVNGGNVYGFTVSGPDRASYTWDLGNEEIRTSTVNRIVCDGLPAGTFTVTVTIDGTSISASAEYTVEEDIQPGPEEEDDTNTIAAATAAVIAALGGAGFFLRKIIINR
jgi:phosphatidylserine/phosphatidylglycerophosphate/cardiolipin synthase-like enzyme